MRCHYHRTAILAEFVQQRDDRRLHVHPRLGDRKRHAIGVDDDRLAGLAKLPPMVELGILERLLEKPDLRGHSAGKVLEDGLLNARELSCIGFPRCKKLHASRSPIDRGSVRC